jgi:hypothetical protein
MKTITPSIAPEAIKNAPLFFAATIGDMLTELLQNARRAGANRVKVIVDDEHHLHVIDDGSGIASPFDVLTFGASGWKGDTASLENPAGCGFWSLASRGCYIETGTAEGHAWSATVTREAFKGEAVVPIREPKEARIGTWITVPLTEGMADSVPDAVCKAAAHLPVKVTLTHRGTDTEIEQTDFLRGADAIIAAESGRIGIYQGGRHSRETTVNFYGHGIAAETVSVCEHDGRHWYAKFDVTDASGLQLVLPARKEIVASKRWDELRRRTETEIFRQIAAQPDGHALTFGQFQRAASLGVEMEEARAVLHAFEPRRADTTWSTASKVEVQPQGHILRMTRDAAMEFAIAASFGDGEQIVLYNDETHFEGYRWYDELTVVVPILEIVQNGKTSAWEVLEDQDVVELLTSDRDENHSYADSILLRLHDPSSGDDVHEGNLPFVVIGEGYEPDEVHIVTTKTASFDPADLATLLENAYFQECDDVEADSYETQQKNWRSECERRAITITDGQEAADCHAIEQAIRNHCMWLMRTDSITTIVVDTPSRAVKVSVEPAASAA